MKILTIRVNFFKKLAELREAIKPFPCRKWTYKKEQYLNVITGEKFIAYTLFETLKD